MKKNDITYEYRVFTNRLIDVESMEIGICTSKVIKDIKPENKVDGRFFHTSDTDEWYFCWKGELQKLNLKGDSDVNAALDEVKKLIGDANDAVEVAKSTAKEAQQAATDAKDAADAAGAAIETIENKADKSDVDALEKKVDAIEIPSLDGYAKLTDIPEVPSMENVALKSDIPSLDGYAKLTDIPEVPSMDNYFTKDEINALIGEAVNITNTILA
jgi:hypothetical protein